MRRSGAEKMEMIRLVEESELSVRSTLRQLGIAPSTFYGWYQRSLDGGPEALQDRKPRPQAQGKIERYHRSMKNVVKLEHYHFPWQLAQVIRDFVASYNNERSHESLDNVTPSDVYHGRHHEVLSEREKITQHTMQRRKSEYRAAKAA